MPQAWAIKDTQVADPFAWVKTVSPYTWTTVDADAKQYNSQSAANADCATLNNTYGAGRFIVGSHPKPH